MNFTNTTVVSLVSAAAATLNVCNSTDDRLNLQCIDDSLQGKSSLVQLLFVTALSGVWLVYLIYFNSRFLGLVLSKILNQFSNDAYIHFGSISISPLSGKCMFRNVSYVTKDFSIRICDGYCIFRWWRPYKFSHWKKKTDLNHGHTRLSVVMSGFEYHQYNRTFEYDRIQTLFQQNSSSEDKKAPVEKKPSDVTNDDIAWWRSLFPVIKVSIPYGKLVYGNKLLPNSLVVSFTDGEFQYMTTEPTTSSDLFLHVLDGTLGFVRIVLMPNLRYDPSVTPAMLGILDVHNEPPPRKMGEGYAVLNSNKVEITYCWDEPGLVKADNLAETPSGANDAESSFIESQFSNWIPPTDEGAIWEMVIRFGKHTNLNFSPWADRQRELLWKFFYPPDYQHLKVTKAPEIGERREAKTFKFSAIIMDRADIDILFSNKEAIHAIQINTAEGSCVEVDVPMTVGEDGYTSHVSGQLLHIEVSTSMQYQSLLKAEMFGFDVKSHFPTQWNGSQTWHCGITASKASASMLFAHMDFLSDLVADWSTKSAPDLMFFVPYTFKFDINLDGIELFLPMNQHNWIDCRSELKDNEDNAYLGVHGEKLSVQFSTPFEDFLPSIYSIPFKFLLDQGQLCIFLPESSTLRSTLLNLARQQQKWDKMPGYSGKSIDWGRTASKTWGLIKGDWVPCWEVPGMDLTLTYTWHPIVETVSIKPTNKTLLSSSKKKDDQSGTNQSSSSSEKHESVKSRARTTVTFDPASLEPDEIRIDLELTRGSVLVLYGSLLDLILIFKDNYLGYDDVYTDFNSKPHGKEDCSAAVAQTLEVNSLEFRPLQVTVNINLDDINGILPIHPTSTYVSQPRVRLDQLHFEMDKNFLQTRLQLLLSGLEISVSDAPVSPGVDPNSNGCVQLSDLQFRGHAMFSGAGLPMGATLIEYAWLTEVLIGAIKGKFTATQIAALVEWAEVFVFLLSNEPNQLKKAFPHRTLPTGIVWDKVKKDGNCFEETDVKYLMVKVRLESVHLRIAQSNSLLELIVSPITVSNGNVQDRGVLEAVSVVIEQVHLKHRMSKSNSDEWLETGEVRFGPFITQVAIATEEESVGELQEEFLRFHDRKTRRLEFLWGRDFVDGHRKGTNGVASILDSVRSMKSWGCSFFAPSSRQHSTFYYEHESSDRKRRLTSPPASCQQIERDFIDGNYFTPDCSEEVFDTRRDYGMSLLVDGKSLLVKPESPEKKVIKEEPLSEKTLSAGQILMTAEIKSQSPEGSHSPFKPMSEKSSSFEDIPRRNSRRKSTDSQLFRSAESAFQSTSSISTDDYYSAESDVGRSISKAHPAVSDQTLHIIASPSILSDPHPLSRPESLEIEQKENVVRRLELNDGEDVELNLSSQIDFPPSVITTKYTAVKENELVACYSYVLSSSKLHDSDWMSDFDQVQEGIHPSVIIDNEESLQKLQKRPSMDILNESRSENCSRIILHIKGGIDIQLTPYLLDSVQQMIDALVMKVTKQHPLGVVNCVQMRCTSDAITDYHLSKLERKEVSEDSSQPDNNNDKPGTRVEVFIDSCRVNLVQATVGDDAVFNLNLNKMPPTPCITVATIRLDKLDLKSQLNSKRDKLLKKARLKNKSFTNSTEDGEESPNLMSTEMLEPSFVLFFCNASVDSLACQLRVLSHDGCAPERSNVTALADDACRAPFKFNNQVLLTAVKTSIDNHIDFQRRPPKPWGWVMAEAGIKKISADLIKYDLQGPVPSKKHACEGNLTVEHLWLNLVSPQSPSQMSKFSRNFRSWNLVTSIAPSSSAWLSPCDRLIGAIDRLNAAVVRQHFVCMAASLTMCMQHAEKNEKTLTKPIQSKYDAMTDLAKSIKSDANCSLCDALQRYLLIEDHLASLETAVSEDRLVPPVGTLESGIQAVVSRWMQMVAGSKTKVEKAEKKNMLSHIERMSSIEENPTKGVTFDGNLDLNTFLTSDSDKDVRRRQSTSGAYDVVDEHTSLVDESRPTHSRAEDLVFEQQQSMYRFFYLGWLAKDERTDTEHNIHFKTSVAKPQPSSQNMSEDIEPIWMQNQTQNDVEAQLESKGNAEDSTLPKKDESNSLMLDAKKTYSNFFHNTKVMQSTEVGGNFLLSHCSGSVSVKATLRSISVDKKESDRIYSRDSVRKRKKEAASLRRQKYANRQHSRIESPIILCENLTFDVSLIDTPVQEEKGKRTNEDPKNESANNNRKRLSIQKFLKTRSKLNGDVGISLEVVKQRIDIALIRLVHQFIQCSDSIQQAMTDLQVNKYTAGASSPEGTASHKRPVSNISSVTANSFYADPSTVYASFRKRVASPNLSRFTTHRDPVLDNDSLASSLSEESLAAVPCWRELYKLNQQSAESLTSYQGNSRLEAELKRGASYIAHSTILNQPFVCMETTVSLKFNELQLLAEVGDLKIFGKLCDLKVDASQTRVSLSPFKHDAKSSMHAQLDQIDVDVSEGGVAIKKTMLTSHVGQCRLDAFTNHQRENEGTNTGKLFIGRIVIDLPQHPASIHDVVARGTRQLSTHIQEFAQTPCYKQSVDLTDGLFPPVTPSNTTIPLTPMTPSAITAFIDLSLGSSEVHTSPVVVGLSLEAEGIDVGANLLPSLTVKYAVGKVTGDGVTGNDAAFTIAMPKHSLHFSSTVASSSQSEFGPVSTDIELPPISGEGELKQHKAQEPADGSELQMKEGEYLSIALSVGSFEHTLTTDLLNHLVFLQEVFMHEVNDVIQKMSTNETVFPVWSDTSIKSAESTEKPMLYQLQLLLDGIQITASTPSNNGVRLKTGTMTFELSNRVVRGGNKLKKIPKYLKLFGKAQVELNLALGTLINNNVYPEVEPEFHQMAYFTTRVGLQNTTQQSDAANRMQGFAGAGKVGEDNSVILISLMRPIFSVQPTAIDKAILIFLAYKNAYDEWTEKREALEDDARFSTRQVVNAFHNRRAAMNNPTQPSAVTSKLFLQLSVHDLGICLPVSHHLGSYDVSTQDELSSALVLTIDNTLISACYAKSLVTTGQFKGFCLRFADDFQPHWDDWSPKGNFTNSFVVPDGTYQICTDTTSYQGPSIITARTTVNVVWQMKGVDIQLDTKIGFHIDRLVKAMTVITGQSVGRESLSSDRFALESETGSIVDEAGDVIDGLLKPSPSDPRMSSSTRELSLKEKSKKLEHEYNEQVQLVNDLRALGAKQTTIEEQERRKHELELALSSLFRQTVKNRLRRSSIKNGSSTAQTPLKRPSHQRSVSSGLKMSPITPLKSVRSAYATLPPDLMRAESNDQAFFPEYNQHPTTQQRFNSFETVSESSEGSSGGYGSDVVDGESPAFPPGKNGDLLTDQDQFSQIMMQLETDLELVLDIRVGIDGGQIVCHPHKEDESEHSSSQTGLHRSLLSAKKPFDTNDTKTFFYVPGVEVKMRYNSEAGLEHKRQEFFTPPGSPKVTQKVPLIKVNTPGGTAKNTHDHSCVYVWFSLQSLPETVISPYFLDFLEQTLNKIPLSSSQSSPEISHLDDQGAVEAFDSTIASLPDAVVFVSVQPSQVLFNCQPMSRVECLLHIPSLDVIFSSIRNPSDTAAVFHFPDRSTDGGASPDSLASAFPTGVGFTAVMSDFSVYVFHPYGSQATSGLEQKAGSGRKDSLSVDLEVVKINIVRTKKGAVNMDASFRLQENATVINISSLIDIGKASFKYDMRRLSEILAFPRAWYRRSIARRLFFGDVPEERTNTDEENFPESPLSPRRSATQTKSEPGNKEEWFSTILYGLKMSRLDVQMNMSNVMGNTLWSCDGLTSQGNVQLQSSGDKNIFLSCGLENSQLSAKGGIIGGNIELRDLYANCHLLEPVEAEPRHKVCVKMRSLDGRIEYMGGCIMMGKLTMVSVKLSDEWKGPKLSTPASSEKSSVFVPGDVGWENFSLSISRSTTPDVIKMLAKLEEFFTQQFQNSLRALSSLRQPGRRESMISRQSSVPAQEVYAFHRHWPSVYRAIRSIGDAPQFLLGGSLCLHGNQLTIVCFHGNNFRSRQWVLFNILEPNIMFSTDVQEIKESITGDEASTLAIQSLTFNLGHEYWLKTVNASSNPMTTVSRVTRSRHENTPSSGASIDEWFAYVTASRNQELTMLRTLNDVSSQESGFNWSSAGGPTSSGSGTSYNHDTDIIFALPKLQLDARTEHMQGPNEPDVTSADKPVVECSFVTEFTDHICVTMDVELIMCLHDLVSSYLKEKQQALSNKNRVGSVGSDNHSSVVDPIDIRQFECKTWQLEPTVRLISWAGRRIEPVGVDYILQKLGFRHARTTIPKWFQRGVLDVLDQTLALIVENLVVTMMQQKKAKPNS